MDVLINLPRYKLPYLLLRLPRAIPLPASCKVDSPTFPSATMTSHSMGLLLPLLLLIPSYALGHLDNPTQDLRTPAVQHTSQDDLLQHGKRKYTDQDNFQPGSQLDVGFADFDDDEEFLQEDPRYGNILYLCLFNGWLQDIFIS